MKKYTCVVETTSNEKYDCLLNAKYELDHAKDDINCVRADSMVLFGTDLALRAGDVKAAYITGEVEVENGTV